MNAAWVADAETITKNKEPTDIMDHGPRHSIRRESHRGGSLQQRFEVEREHCSKSVPSEILRQSYRISV